MASFRQHCLQANYQTRVWHLCEEQAPAIQLPAEHGWVFDRNGIIEIKWMNCQPAPDEVYLLPFYFSKHIFNVQQIFSHLIAFSIYKF